MKNQCHIFRISGSMHTLVVFAIRWNARRRVLDSILLLFLALTRLRVTLCVVSENDMGFLGGWVVCVSATQRARRVWRPVDPKP